VQIAKGETIESYFDDVLGFRARDQDVGCDFQFETPEFLFAGEMLCGNTGSAIFNEREIRLGFRFGELVFGMRVDGSAGAAGGVEEQELGSEGVGGDVGGAELSDAEFEGGAEVHG